MHVRTTLPAPAGRRPSHRRAAAAVEFAVVSVAFVTLVLGIIELGRALMVQHLLTNAARQACRVGVLPGKTNSEISAVAVTTLANQGITGDVVSVQVND